MSESDFLKAAYDGDIDSIRAYVDQGGDVNVVNRKGMSALMLATWLGRPTEIVEILIRNGADLALRQPSSGWRALTFAAVDGHADHLRMLLDHGDRVDPQGADWKALMFAIQYRNVATSRILLEAGADSDVRDERGRTPLMRAAANSDTAALELLLEHHAGVDLADNDGMTALMYAAKKANVRNVQLLIEHGADPEKRNHAGERAIEIATAAKKQKVAAALQAG